MKQFLPEEQRGRTLSNIMVVVVGILLAAALFYINHIVAFVKTLWDVLTPFIIGLAVAFLLMPIVHRVEAFFNKALFRRKPRPKLSRGLATAIAFLVLITLVAGFFAILVPQLITSVRSIVPAVSRFYNRNAEYINQFLLKYEFLNIENEQLVVAWENLISLFGNYANVAVDFLSTFSSSIYNVIFQVLVGLVAAFYLLMDKERFCAQVKKIIYALFKPSVCETQIYWTRRANKIFAGFITGKILDSLIIGVLCYVFMLIFRIEYAVLISVIVGITNIVPFFGPFIGAVPSIIILLLVNPLSALWFGVFIIILQQVDGNIIGPFILGDYVGLSPFWIMMSIMVGSGLFGFMGMLLSVPVFALIYAIVRTVIELRLKKRHMPTDSAYYMNAPENMRKGDGDEASDI